MSRLLITALALAALTACSGGGFGSPVGPCGFGPCPAPSYTLGGTVSGLVGSGLALQNNGVASNSIIDRAANGIYPNLTGGTVAEGTTTYSVTVRTQPTNPSQTCVVANGTGTMNNANVTNIAVMCTTTAGRFLYVVNGGSNNISAFLINASSGALTAISGSPFPAGNMPYSVAVEPSGRFAYVANQGDGSVSAFTIDRSSGALTVVSGSPFASGPVPFSVATDPTSKFVYVTNGNSGNVSAYTIDANNGALTAIAGSPFASGNAPYSVSVEPFGRFAYVANGGSNSVSAFTIGGTSGVLTAVTSSPFAAGNIPRSVAIDVTNVTSGRFVYVANASSNNVSAYTIDTSNGALAVVSGSPFSAGSAPWSVVVDPTGKFAFVSNAGSSDVSVYAIDAASGALTAVGGSPFAAGSLPYAIAVSN